MLKKSFPFFFIQFVLKEFLLLFFGVIISPPARFLLLLFTGAHTVISPLSAQNKTIDSLHTLLRKDMNDANKAVHLNELCREYNNMGSYDTAFRYGNAALQLAERLNFPQEIATAYSNMGVIYYYHGNYDKALDFFFTSLKIGKETGDKKRIAVSYNNMGIIYKQQGNYEKALENHFASLKIREEAGDKKGIAASYNNIGVVYSEQSISPLIPLQKKAELLDKALKNYFALLKIGKEIGDKQGIATSYNNIGSTYSKQAASPIIPLQNKEKLLNRALENYFASLKIGKEVSNKQGIATSYIGVANVYTDKLNYVEATAWFQKGLRLANEIGVKQLLLEAYKGLSEVNEKMSDYYNAYKYHRLYSQIRDSIFNEESSKRIAELQIKYEAEKKDKEIQFQALQLSEQKLLLKSNRTLFFIMIICSILLIAFGWTAFSRSRIKQQGQLKSEILRQQELRTNAIIETQEQERKHIAQDLHDGIGHKLTTLKINFEKITENIHTISPEQRTIFKQTENILDETHKEVRTLSHRMMPKALQERELAESVSDLLDQTCANSKVKYQLKNDLPMGLPSTIQVCLYRVLQELLNNIFKHAQATTIAVQLFKNKNTVIMMVEDNGKGIQKMEFHSDQVGKSNTTNLSVETLAQAGGIGLHNIAGRIHTLKGVFTIEPSPVKGTIATVRIPFPRT